MQYWLREINTHMWSDAISNDALWRLKGVP